MKLSTKGRYGLAAMLFLARHDEEGPVSLRSMAATGIQPDYLEQLLGSLRKAGLVITATEGPVRFCDCGTDSAACCQKEHCDTRHVWSLLSERMNDLLDSITLAGVLADLDKEAAQP